MKRRLEIRSAALEMSRTPVVISRTRRRMKPQVRGRLLEMLDILKTNPAVLVRRALTYLMPPRCGGAPMTFPPSATTQTEAEPHDRPR
jgi:hypothetical protein